MGAIISVLLVLPLASPTVEDRADTLLVMKLKALDASEEEILAATHAIAEQVARHTNQRVVSALDIETLIAEHLELERLGSTDAMALEDFAEVANAQLVVSGSLGRVGGELLLNIALVNAAAGRGLGRSSRAAATLDELLASLPELVAEVFGEQSAGEATRYELPQGEETALAVLDLDPLGLDTNVVANLSQVLAAEVKKIPGTRVISKADIASMLALEAERDRMACVDDIVCMTEIGGALGASKLVVGHAGKMGDSYIISLRLIDVANVQVDNRATETFQGLEEQLLPAVKRAGRRLLGVPEEGDGELAISGSEEEAEVFVDDELRGALPLPAIAALSPGRHSVRVAKDGYFVWRSDVYVEPTATSALWVQLEEEPLEWYQQWWVWAATGAVVAGGTALAIILTRPKDGALELTAPVPEFAP